LLGKWLPALSDSGDISFFEETECWGAVSMDGLVSFLKSVVFFDIMKVVSSDNYGSLHFCGDHDTPKTISFATLLEQSASDVDLSGEGAFSVHVVSFNCFSWGFDACNVNYRVYQVQPSSRISLQLRFSLQGVF
jgi:hypothetical protein